MEGTANITPITAGIIIAGLLVSTTSAIVPEFSHYKMMFGVLSAGLLPYVIYGFAVAYLKPALSLAIGLTVLAIHTGLVVNERFTGTVDYSNGTVYYVPIALALFLVPVLILSARKPWHY